MPSCPLCFRDQGTSSRCPHCGGVEGSRSVTLALIPGTLLAGQYRLGQVLGQPGGFGITYLAWDEKLQTRVAIKEFFPREFAGRGTDRVTLLPHTERDRPLFDYGLQQFLGEARTLARFDHPNIVRVRNFFEANGTGYLVMDYYDGESLFAYLARQPGGRLREDLAVRILIPVLDGLRAVHAAGILHRDIDPHNVYLTTQGRVILLDFGAARGAVGDRSRSLSVILKPGYAPYEQYAPSGQQGPWTDVYACAATLYRMVTGMVPADALSRMMEDALKPAHEVNPEVSPRLGEVLQRAMALHPADRPQSAEEFQTLLLEEKPLQPIASGGDWRVTTGGGVSGGSAERRVSGRRPTAPAGRKAEVQRWAPIAAGVVLLLAGSGAAIYGTLRPAAPTEVARTPIVERPLPEDPARPPEPRPNEEEARPSPDEPAPVPSQPPQLQPERPAPQPERPTPQPPAPQPVRPGPPPPGAQPPVERPANPGGGPGAIGPEPPVARPAEPDTPLVRPTPPPQPPVAAVLNAGMSRCRDAVVARNLASIRDLYKVVEAADEPNRERLLSFLEREPAHLQIVVQGDPTAPQPSGGRATGQFRTEFRWRSSFGTGQRESVVFRVDFDQTGEGWRMTTCRIVGSPRLRA